MSNEKNENNIQVKLKSSELTDEEKFSLLEQYELEILNYKRSKQYFETIKIYKELISRNIYPSARIFSNVLSVYGDLKQYFSALRVWERVVQTIEQNKDLPPTKYGPMTQMNLNVINSMIYVCAKTGNDKKALELYEDIEKKYNLKPDGVSVNCIISAMGKVKNLGKAQTIYNEFSVNNPNSYSLEILTTLADMYGTSNQFSKILEIYQIIQDNKIPIDYMFVSVIVKHVLRADGEEALVLLSKLKESGNLSTSTFSNLIIDFTNEKEALILLELIKNIGASPNVVLYNSIITKICKTIPHTRQWISKMESDGIRPNDVCYNHLLMLAATPAKPEKVELVSEIFSEMTSKKILPTEPTYCIMIRFYSQIQQKSIATKFIEVLRKNNLILSPQSYSALIRMYSFGGPFDKLTDTIQEVQSLKIGLPPSTRDIMFKSLLKLGKYHEIANYIKYSISISENIDMGHVLTLYKHLLIRSDSYPKFEYESSLLHSISSPLYTKEVRSPGRIIADKIILLDVHNTIYNTPGILYESLHEYWLTVMAASVFPKKGPGLLCQILLQALNSISSDEDRVIVFVEFLNMLEKSSLLFADDISAWRTKLLGEGKQNKLIHSKFQSFAKYVQEKTKISSSFSSGSRIFKPNI